MASEPHLPRCGFELMPLGPLLRWLARAFIVLSVGWLAFVVGDLVVTAPDAGSVASWQTIVVVVAVLFTVPVAVMGWRSTLMRYPQTETMRDLSWSLTSVQRRAVGRALRRGDPIPAAHRPYAVATTAVNRRAFIVGAFVIPNSWAQLINTSMQKPGSGPFWVMLGMATVVSVLISGGVLLQLRCERSVRAIG